MAADVVDDLGSGFDGAASGGGVEGVDGEDGVGFLFEDGFDDGEDAGLFFVGGEGSCVGASGFAAQVEDVGALFEELEGLGEGSLGGVLGGVEVAAVGEGVGRDVEDAHEDGPLAQRKGAGAEVPVVMATRGKGHGWILASHCAWGGRSHAFLGLRAALPLVGIIFIPTNVRSVPLAAARQGIRATTWPLHAQWAGPAGHANARLRGW